MTEETQKKAHVIVVSNEKGGTGKSTISMHLAIKLMQEGFNVAVLDLDGRQGTLSKYIENRTNYCQKNNVNLPIPEYFRFSLEPNPYLIPSSREKVAFQIYELSFKFDAIIIDTPGTKNYLFEEAHKYADTLITPISDSMVDLNILADIDYAEERITTPGPYANFVWDIKKYLAAQGKPYLNWIVVGNKFSNINSRNKSLVFKFLNSMSRLYGFRFLEGLRDRTIYKELFLEGLTVLDMSHPQLKLRMSISHLAAKQEIRRLAEFICPE